jgi:hypothetical protein
MQSSEFKKNGYHQNDNNKKTTKKPLLYFLVIRSDNLPFKVHADAPKYFCIIDSPENIKGLPAHLKEAPFILKKVFRTISVLHRFQHSLLTTKNS